MIKKDVVSSEDTEQVERETTDPWSPLLPHL